MPICTTSTKYGTFSYFSTDGIGKSIARGNFWEPFLQPTFDELKEGSVVVDVGANLGWFTLYAATRGATVWAFEACPEVFELLLRNVKQNSLTDKVIALPLALHKSYTELSALELTPENPAHQVIKDGRIDTEQWENSGSFSLRPNLRGPYPQWGIPLDALKLSKVDLIKIDTEGSDLEVLQGAKRTIHRFHPTLCYEVLSISPDAQKNAARRKEFSDFVESLGYDACKVYEGMEGNYQEFVAKPKQAVTVIPKPETKKVEVVSVPPRFGLVLPSYAWNADRVRWAQSSLKSLELTNLDGLEKPLLYAIPKGGESMSLLTSHKFPQLEVKIVPQPQDINSNDGCMAWGFNVMTQTPGITHCLMLADDWLYNPRWLLELRDLIARRKGARAWWVYRSAYEEIHKTLKIDEPDVLVRSMNGGGCVTVEEWRDWKIDPHRCPRETHNMGNISLDLLHPQERPGERWVTKKSYVINVGLVGQCQRLETPDFAVDFVGLT